MWCDSLIRRTLSRSDNLEEEDTKSQGISRQWLRERIEVEWVDGIDSGFLIAIKSECQMSSRGKLGWSQQCGIFKWLAIWANKTLLQACFVKKVMTGLSKVFQVRMREVCKLTENQEMAKPDEYVLGWPNKQGSMLISRPPKRAGATRHQPQTFIWPTEYRVTIQLVQNLPLTLIWKLHFSVRTLMQLSNQCQQEVCHNLNGHPVLLH